MRPHLYSGSRLVGLGVYAIAVHALIAGCMPRKPTESHATAEANPACTGAPTPRTNEPQPMQVLDTQHVDRFQAIAFGPDDRLATANKDGSVRIWDLRTGALVSISRHPRLGDYVRELRWDGPRLGMLGAAWNPSTGSATRTIDQLGAVISEDAPSAGSFFSANPTVAQDGLSVSIERGGTRFVFPIPPDLRSNALGPVLQSSRDGSVLAASFHDSEVVIWPKPESTPRRISAGGGVSTVAISPDGRYVAAAFRTASLTQRPFSDHALSLIDTTNAYASSVLSEELSWTKLAFSPDGSRLAAINNDRIEVWTVADGRHVGTGYGKRSMTGQEGTGASFRLFEDLQFSPDGHWLIGATMTGGLDVYEAKTLRPAHSLGAKVAPLNDAILIGDRLATIGPHSVNIWSISEAKIIEQAILPDVGGAYRDGDDLMVMRPAYDRVSCGHNERPVFQDRWRRLAMPEFYPRLLEFDIGDDREAGLRARDELSQMVSSRFGKPRCLTDRFLDAVVGQPEPVVFHKINYVNYEMHDPSTGRTIQLDRGKSLLGDTLDSFAIERDRYVYALTHERKLKIWDWKTGHLLRELYAVKHFATTGNLVAVSRADEIVVNDLGTGRETPAIHPGGEVTALAFRSPREMLVGLLDGRLVAVRDGQVVATMTSSGGAIRSIHGDPLSERATTISADGSVRIWYLNPLHEAIALVSYEDAEWIAYTPRGAYRGSPEAANRVHWTFANAESFGFEQFASLFERPEIVEKRARGAMIDVDVNPPRPPSVEAKLLSVTPRAARIGVTTRGPARIDRVAAFVEGRMIASANICARAGTTILEVPAAESRVAIAAFDSDGLASNTALVELSSKVAHSKSDVWVVAAGVSRYPTLDAASQLWFADADARSVSTAFSALAGAHHSFASAHIALLTNEQVSAANLKAELAKLASMRPDDLAIVFLAGHGIKLHGDGESALLTATANEHDAIKWKDISEAIDKLPGRVLVLLDACHAGHLTRDRIIANADLAGRLAHASRAGVVVFAASKGRQLSYESGRGTRSIEVGTEGHAATKPLDGHGVFTHAVVQSLADQATDRDGDGAIDLDELIAAVTRRVETETQGRQTPWLSRRELFGSFTVRPAGGE